MSGSVLARATHLAEVTLLDGRRVTLDTTGKNWVESDIRVHMLDFSWFEPHVTWKASAFQVLKGLLSTHSLVYAGQCLSFFGRFASEVTSSLPESDNLSLLQLEQWPAKYPLSGWPFMQAVLNRWTASGLPGLGQDIRAFLAQPEKFEEEGNGWYFALVANDPERGAFTEQELRSVREGVNRAFEERHISLRDWAMTWFLVATGVRPVQIARMTVGDVLFTLGPDGDEATLLIPLAKGENQVVRDRWKRRAPSVLSEVLARYLASPEMREAAAETPLFDDQSVKVSARIERVFRHAETYSERLRGPIPVFPYRFRYTLGTRALAQGASDHEVARLLTHRTTHCIQYYRAAMPMLQRPIRDALGPEMTFLAHAFQGRLIGTLEEATRRGEPGAVIRDFAHMMGQSLGACGTRAECHQDAPRACLSCSKFEPLSDAPWERFLDVLLDDLTHEEEDRIRLITQEQVDAVRGIIAERDGWSARQHA